MPFVFANVDGRSCLVSADTYFDLETISSGQVPADPMLALCHEKELHALAAQLSDFSPSGRIADIVLGPPVTRPQKSFAVGLNYKSHAAEASMELPEFPMVFTKFPSCIVGPTANVEMRSDAVDYEAELVVVIGAGGKDIAEEDAWNHIIGLTVGQDISDRVVQMSSKPPHFDLGKSFDTFGPIGPVMVSRDSFANPNSLKISCEVNGEVRQNALTSSLIFSIPFLVSYLSRITTLVCGDIIFTGTPDGVGMTQGKLLRDGDVITTTIEGIGSMTNKCVRVSNYGG